jgi:hypothetical protein
MKYALTCHCCLYACLSILILEIHKILICVPAKKARMRHTNWSFIMRMRLRIKCYVDKLVYFRTCGGEAILSTNNILNKLPKNKTIEIPYESRKGKMSS